MLYLLAALIFARLMFWILVFSKLARYTTIESANRKEAVSVVICVKNNKNSLEILLKKLLKQNHECFEIIVVDDYSTDGVKIMIENLQTPLIVYTKPEKDVPGKKRALTKGVEMARYDWILVTDSDCMPSSLDWISLMAGQAIQDQKEIVLGYGPLHDKGIIGQITQYEASYVAMQYLSYALMGIPYMGVGRNMLYSKRLFLETDPFADNFDVASGDDDMLVQKASNAKNTTICIHANAHCKSIGAKNLGEFIRQKTRHAGTSPLYKTKHKILLGLFAALHLAIYFLLLTGLLFEKIDLKDCISSWVLMIAVMAPIQYICFAKLREQKAVFSLILSDFILSLLYFTIGLSTLFKTNKIWN
jgi:poly-beta-1,6-N-acetyl-D-glucosamine synthase